MNLKSVVTCILFALFLIPGCIDSDAAEDKIYDLSELEMNEGVVLIDFMATWCSPCRAEIDELKEVYENYGGEVTIISVDVDFKETKELLAQYRKEVGADWDFAVDDIGLSQQYNVRSIPTLAILKDGEPVSIVVGTTSAAETMGIISETL